MIIEVVYEVGLGGTSSVTMGEDKFDFEISEFKENKYGDIGIEINGYGKICIIDDVYNRNSLSGNNYVSIGEYNKVFTDLKLKIVEEIEKEIKSFF